MKYSCPATTMATATGTGERDWDWDWDRDWDRDWDWDSHQVRWPPQMSDIFSNVASVAGCVAAPKGSALATAAACGTSFANDFDIDSAAWLPWTCYPIACTGCFANEQQNCQLDATWCGVVWRGVEWSGVGGSIRAENRITLDLI